MPGRKTIITPIVAVLVTVAFAGCVPGQDGPDHGFQRGEDFSYMADTASESRKLALISGEVGSNGAVTGELQVVEVRNGAVGRDVTEFTGTAAEDGTAVFRGIGPEESDVTASLSDEKAVMTLDKEVGISASEWNRASLPAFNSAIQNLARG